MLAVQEFSLLEHICAAGRKWPPRVTIPPGDDLAAVRFGNMEVFMGTDQVADGVHFELSRCSLLAVARKALNRNISDVAAMAARPVCALVATMLPRTFRQPQAIELFDHFNAIATRYDCPLVGGDISIWDGPLQMTVTIIAESDGITPVTRVGACAGDVICVTGSLGGSFQEIDGKPHHLYFEPRVELARLLAGNKWSRPRCMIDLSDGLAVDLGHLCAASGLGAEVEMARLPIAPAAQLATDRDGRPVWQHVVGDGEDYELLFTVSEEQADHFLPFEHDGVRVTRIGRMTPLDQAGSIIFRFGDGTCCGPEELGWEHRGG